MRIFVTGTGRCGTSTFFHACQHITNYTCGHESTSGRVQEHSYPDHHIEISSQLTYAMGVLRRKYPESFWIRLTRERYSCIQSLARNCQEAMRAYSLQWFQCPDPSSIFEVATIFYDQTNALIAESAPDYIQFSLEEAHRNWTGLWQDMGFEGDLEASLLEWNRRYNPSEKRGRDNWNPKS